MSAVRSYLAPDVRVRTLLEAAGRVYEAKGLRELTVAEVAKEAGVSRALGYAFFPDRESLQVAFFEQRVMQAEGFADLAATMGLTAADRVMQLFERLCELPMCDLYATNAVVHARSNDDLVPVRLKMEAMLRSRWESLLDFENGPPGLFASVWLFTENSLSIAIAVREGRMLKQGATGLLLDMVNAAVDRMVRLLDRSPDGRPLSQIGASSTSDANG